MGQTIITFCDPCGENFRTSAEPYNVIINGVEFEIDLCDEHAKQAVYPLDTMLTESGRRIGGKKRGPYKKSDSASSKSPDEMPRSQRTVPGGFKCPECGVSYEYSNTLRSHLVNAESMEPLRASQVIDQVVSDAFGKGAHECTFADCPVTSDTTAGLKAHERLHTRVATS